MANSNFNEDAFWEQYLLDLEGTDGRATVHSGYVSLWRVRKLGPALISLANRGAQFCASIQEPDDWHLPDSALSRDAYLLRTDFRSAIKYLEDVRAHVSLRKDDHTKFAVVDGKIFWKGTLNILSHNRKHESMDRITDPDQIKYFVDKYKLYDCAVCELNRNLCGIVNGEASVEEMIEILFRHLSLSRVSQNLSQKDLAELSGFGQGRISQLEIGDIDPKSSTLLRITRALKFTLVPVPDLLIPSIAQILVRQKDLL